MGRNGDMFRGLRGGLQPRNSSGDLDAQHPDDAWPVPMLDAGGVPMVPAQLEIAGMDGHPDDWFFGAAPVPQPDMCGATDLGMERAPVIGSIPADWTTGETEDVDALFPADVHEFHKDDDAGPAIVPEFPADDEPEPAAQFRSQIDGRIVDPARRLALLRAARIIGHCDISERSRRQRAMWRLASLIEAFPHGSSVRAVENLAIEGATTDE